MHLETVIVLHHWTLLLTSIVNNAFNYSKEIVSINLENATDTDISSMFSECTKLTTVNLSRIVTIGYATFRNCSSLSSIELPKATSINSYSFKDCITLTSVILRSPTVCKLKHSDAFLGTPIKSGNGYIYVPDELIKQYKTATNWSVYANQIKPLSEYTE